MRFWERQCDRAHDGSVQAEHQQHSDNSQNGLCKRCHCQPSIQKSCELLHLPAGATRSNNGCTQGVKPQLALQDFENLNEFISTQKTQTPSHGPDSAWLSIP